MNKEIEALWPELVWINDVELREKTASAWQTALNKSQLTIPDLDRIPFTLLVPDVKTSFMTHKRAVVHLAKQCGETIQSFFGDELPLDMDALISGAILCDVGKLLEYEFSEGKVVQGKYGQYLRHPFSGVSLAEQCGIPPQVCHIIAAHATEGDHVKRSVEAYIVHHVDFMTFLPFKGRLEA